MMLSKVAERIYWSARYLERIESTCRIISIYDKFLFDTPHSVSISWYNLIEINSLESDFNQRYSIRDERNVVKFLLADKSNSSSIVSSIAILRENIRTTRDVVLEDTWEMINELNIFVNDHIQQGIVRSKRFDFLDQVVKGCQQILGLLYGNMPHDAAWDFLRLGRNLERADMTTRNLDAGAAASLELVEDENAVNSAQIIWGNVLRALNAEQSYRRAMRSSVKGKAVAQYLVADTQFPRAIQHCFDALINSCAHLPNSQELVTLLKKKKRALFANKKPHSLNATFRDYLNDIQIELGDIHHQISKTWFPAID